MSDYESLHKYLKLSKIQNTDTYFLSKLYDILYTTCGYSESFQEIVVMNIAHTF